MSACGTPSSRLPGKVHNRSSPILPSMAGSKVTVVELQRSTSLSAPHCIRRYVVNGSAYLEIPNSLKHQKIEGPNGGKPMNVRHPGIALAALLGAAAVA